MNQILSINLPYLAKHPQLVRTVERFRNKPDPTQYKIEKAKNGSPTLIIVSETNRTFSYHSRYNPEAEAKRQVETADLNQSHVLLLGLGLGYLLEEIVSRVPQPGYPHQIIVVEPDPKVFFHALTNRDMRAMLSDQRIDWCIGMTPDEFGDVWNIALDWAALNKLAIIEHPPSIARYNQYFGRIMEKVRYFSRRSKGNLVTLMHNGTEFLTNNLLNMDALIKFPGVYRLFDKFADVPAVVVAAGPSLEKNAHLLSKVKGKFLIIAVDTAFRQLVVRGIRPDIVCAADPSYLNSLDFVGVENETEVILAFEPMSHPDIPRSFKGPKMLMTFGGGIAGWLEEFREKLGTLTCWGSIGTTAFDMARKFGCDPIIFIGLDLSFQDGRLHARGSYSDDVFFDGLHPFTSIEHETTDYILTKGAHRFVKPDGSYIYTDQNMFLYKGWFEDQFQRTKQKIINATEGGIIGKFAENMPFAKAVDLYIDRGKNVHDILYRALSYPTEISYEKLHERVATMISELRSHEKNAELGLSLCRKMLRTCESKKAAELLGKEKVMLEDIQRLHDNLCSDSTMFNWFSIHQARFVTRHTMEINALKTNVDATVGDWIGELKAFFEAMSKFHEYQIPLMELGLRSIEKDSSQKSTKLGIQYQGTKKFAVGIPRNSGNCSGKNQPGSWMVVTSATQKDSYRKTQIDTASPEMLVLMLYDGALRFMGTAEEEFEKGNKEGINNALLRVQAIITELLTSLNKEKGGEIAVNLERLYLFFLEKLMEANVKKDPEPMRSIRPLIENLRNIWAEAMKQNAKNPTPGAPAQRLNIAV